MPVQSATNPNDEVLDIEYLSENEVISCLWSKSANDKCRIGLADVLIYEDGAPVRWYVTGKTGEVIKKKAVDIPAVKDRWEKIAAKSQADYIAIIRQDKGLVKFLGPELWEQFIANKTADRSIISAHAFVKGQNMGIFRNKFILTDRLGRFNTTTHTYPYGKQEIDRTVKRGAGGAVSETLPKVVEPLIILEEANVVLTESRAAAIKNIMDLATNTVVRYLENMLGVKVLELSIDYIIDYQSQLWMLWTSPAKIVRTTHLANVTVPGLATGDRSGRMAWAGPKYADDYKGMVLDGRVPGHTSVFPRSRSPTRSPSPDVGSTSGSRRMRDDMSQGMTTTASGVNSVASLDAQGKVLAARAGVIIDSAVNTVESGIAKKASTRPHHSPKKGHSAFAQNVNVIESDNILDPNKNQFPDAFKCKGEYCHIKLVAGGELQQSAKADAHTIEKCFTQKELDTLKKHKSFAQMMDFSADGPGLAVISNKSIVLAQKERRSLEASGEDGMSWNRYPLSPRSKLKSSAEQSAVAKAMAEEIAIQERLAKDKEHRDEFTKQMVQIYKDVRVCGVCFKVYTTLDWAREILGTSDLHGAGLEKKESLKNGTIAPSSPSKTRRSDSRGGSVGMAEENKSMGSTETESTRGRSKSKKDLHGTAPVGNSAQESAEESKISMSKTLPTARPSPGKGSPKRQGSPSPEGRKQKNRQDDKRTWKDYESRGGAKDHKEFADLDDYLRAGAGTLAERKMREKEAFMRKRVQQLTRNQGSEDAEDSEGKLHGAEETQNLYRGQVLLACEDNIHAFEAKQILEEAFFEVHLSRDGRQAINDFQDREEGKKFDCILCQRDLPLGDAAEIVVTIRDIEKIERRRAAKNAARAGKGVQPYTKRYPVICYTDKTTPEDLKVYMKADMDGCVSFPVNKISLLNTIRAAIPHHLAQLDKPLPQPPPEGAKVYKLGAMGQLEGAKDSASRAAETLPVSAKLDTDIAFNGVVQIDADTRVPYTVLDASRTSPLATNPNKPFFNLIVIHDMFDTAERFKILLRPMVQKYLGLQVLLWNYPGQAFTEWRAEQLLNNEYCASCLNEVLGQVGERGTKDFDTSRPFYIMGYGHGSSIATFYASHYRVPNLRGIISVNGWAFIDSYLAGVMHDCSNIFECSPPSRPDLPVYFFSRFLFSKDYLAKVSVPLALNIYTAVHNPISLIGRINLCKGVMGAVDVRPLLKEIDCPIICLQSTQDTFARPLHTEPFVHNRGGEVRSIFKSLRDPSKTCIVWMKGGHEVFQECRKQTQVLIEQLLTGFFEGHDITFPSAPIVDKQAAEMGLLVSNQTGEQRVLGTMASSVEDKFIDSVLGTMKKVTTNTNSAERSVSPTNKTNTSVSAVSSVGGDSKRGRSNSPSKSKSGSVVFSSNDPNAWNDFSQTIAEGSYMGKQAAHQRSKKGKHGVSEESTLVMDPSIVSFERQDSLAYGPKATNEKLKGTGLTVADFPEVKEYMGWRLKRNKKRLQRLQGAARIIQGGFRAFMARVFVRNMKRKKAASVIQKAYRGWIGRCDFLDQARRIWATQMIQRTYRGYLGRKWYFIYRLRIVSAANIQRVFRGHKGRKFVAGIKRIRNKAASIIQSLFRRYKGRKDAFALRLKRNSAQVLQRVYRGHLGRRKANAERDKYIFSRSQSQGIEFGRQMLLEHKLHATKLQSDVTLLTQDKVAAEEQVEALLEEISSFEEGVRTLEKEMHQLTRVEAEAAAYMDEESRYALRDQKAKLDKEFGNMLGKIGNRKDLLYDLEKKLSAIDKARQVKEEELRTLERKLVVLLEEQQNELNAIKRKQDVRGSMLAASHQEMLKATSGAPGSNALTIQNESKGGGGVVGMGGSSGPSLQEKKQAAQLMQSTETLMKFGFMSMSMTYFSSLNMIKALRTVSAQDTVMAALADVHTQKAIAGGASAGASASERKPDFAPSLKSGQMGGQESLRVSAWSVEDVSKWLQTISLGQYTEAFIDAAIDGEFLYDLNDDDLKNTLGIEHRLHRKKILGSVHRLKMAEAQKDSRLAALLKETGQSEMPEIAPDQDPLGNFPDNPFKPRDTVNAADRRHMDGPTLSIDEILSLVRHSKLSLLKDALDHIPNKPFDKTLVQVSYVPDFGTVYVEGYEKLPFHINKMDEFGNTMLGLACQNGNIKIAKYLISKGANPNHQNKLGQTAGHFAIAYKFYDLSQWLFENGADDTLQNKFHLTAYDGLSPDGEDDNDDKKDD